MDGFPVISIVSIDVQRSNIFATKLAELSIFTDFKELQLTNMFKPVNSYSVIDDGITTDSIDEFIKTSLVSFVTG